MRKTANNKRAVADKAAASETLNGQQASRLRREKRQWEKDHESEFNTPEYDRNIAEFDDLINRHAETSDEEVFHKVKRLKGAKKPTPTTSPTIEEVKPAEPAPPVANPSSFNPPPMPEWFETAQQAIDYRESYRESEIAFYKSLGLSDADALKMFRSADARSQIDPSAIEAKLSDEATRRLEAHDQGKDGPVYIFDRTYDPSSIVGETDKVELARSIVANLSREDAPNEFGDKMLHAVIALRQLKENGGTWSDIAKALDKYTTQSSSSMGDKAFVFKLWGEKNTQIYRSSGN